MVTYDHRDSRFFELPEPQKGPPSRTGYMSLQFLCCGFAFRGIS